jgi:hypothetical protein
MKARDKAIRSKIMINNSQLSVTQAFAQTGRILFVSHPILLLAASRRRRSSSCRRKSL